MLSWVLMCSIVLECAHMLGMLDVGHTETLNPKLNIFFFSFCKEVVTRLTTNLTSNKEFYTNSNGCDFHKWVNIRFFFVSCL
jgi:hypothetical protein